MKGSEEVTFFEKKVTKKTSALRVALGECRLGSPAGGPNRHSPNATRRAKSFCALFSKSASFLAPPAKCSAA
jgi:hypothetical protein